MEMLARVRSWLRHVTRRSAVERDLRDELQFHIESLTDDLVRRGVPADEAPRRARAAFGGVEARKIDCREAIGLRLFDELRADVRYAFRQLRRSPVFTAVAVLSLALGLGANTAIVSLMEAALWKPMTVREPEQLRLFSWVSGPRSLMANTWGEWGYKAEKGRASTSFSVPVFDLLRQHSAVFERIVAFKPIGRLTAVIDGQAELVYGHLVSGELYDALGVVPIAGRPIQPADDRADRAETVGVISDGFWARRFGRDPGVIGRQILVNQIPVTIVGVNPPGFVGLEAAERPDLFLPVHAQPAVLPRGESPGGTLLDNPDSWWLLIVGRLRPGVSGAAAQSAMEVAFQQAVRATLPVRPNRDQPHLRLLSGARGLDNLREEFGSPLRILFGFVSLVLLMACTNVAMLFLARAAARRRELGLRLALGASRLRLTRQLLTEGLVLGTIGGACGALVGYAARDIIPGFVSQPWSSWQFQAAFDLRVLLLTGLATLVTSALFSVAPIWQSRRVEVTTALKDGGRTAVGIARPLRGRALIVVQVGVSVCLLIGAGLFARTLINLRAVPLGFEPQRLVLFTIDPPRTRYANEARAALFARLQDAIEKIPGVEAASVAQDVLIARSQSGTRVGVDGKTPWRDTWVNDVGRRYFEALRIPILNGRSFEDRDGPNAPAVAIVNQRFVRQFGLEGRAVGSTIENGDRKFEIVGVCGDTRVSKSREPVPPVFYRLVTQAPDVGRLTFHVRTASRVSAIMASVRDVVRSIDKDLTMYEVRTQVQQIDATLSRERLFVALTCAFGMLALILAAVGIYGVLAQTVSRRTGEIGIRMALGAMRRDVLVMVLREASVLAAIGIVLGVLVASRASRLIEAVLFGVEPIDPITIAGAIVTMLIVALLAGWVPARRASRLDPMDALRHE